MNSLDKVKIGLALLLVIAGVVGFYALPEAQTLVRSLAVVAGLLLAAGLLWFTQSGRDFVEYARDSWKEAQKVVWQEKRNLANDDDRLCVCRGAGGIHVDC